MKRRPLHVRVDGVARRMLRGATRIAALLALGLATLAAPTLAAAQDERPSARSEPQQQAQDDLVLRVFEIRYRPVSEVSLLVAPLLSPDALFEMNAKLRTVTVRDRPDIVRQVADFVRQFDVPPHAAVIRIVVEKARRFDDGSAEARFSDTAGWSFERLAETTLEVLERGRAVQSFGPGEALEIRVSLDAVDVDRDLLHFEEFTLARTEDSPAGPRRRELLSTSLELEDRVGKVVMAAASEQASEGLVVRVVGLIRERSTGEER